MRRFWQRIPLLASALLAAAVALPARAHAAEAALSWVRLEGAEGCIAAPALAKLVEERIGRAVLQPHARAELSIEGRVGPQPNGGWLAIVDVGGRDGRLLGRRELRVKEGPCAALDRPVSLIISLIIDRDAAGPGLIEGAGLSQDAQQLLAQLDLPSADGEELLASLAPLSPEPARPLALASNAQAPAAQSARSTAQSPQPKAKMISVPEEEWRRLQSLAPEDAPPSPSAGTPAWPGYALLGLGGLATGLTIYANARVRSIDANPLVRQYSDAVARGNAFATLPTDMFNDICVAARRGLPYDVGAEAARDVADLCDEGQTLEALQWVFAGTALASFAVGAVWLIWIADDGGRDDAAHSARAPALMLQPSIGREFNGATLRLQL